jgi:hypothetical protein
MSKLEKRSGVTRSRKRRWAEAGHESRGPAILQLAGRRGDLATGSRTGKLLWRFQTGGRIAASPMSYSVDGNNTLRFPRQRAVWPHCRKRRNDTSASGCTAVQRPAVSSAPHPRRSTNSPPEPPSKCSATANSPKAGLGTQRRLSCSAISRPTPS